jgi:hypothetical protein
MAPKVDDEDSDLPPDFPTFKDQTIHEIFKTVFEKETSKGALFQDSVQALHLSSEYLRLFTVSRVARARRNLKAGQAEAFHRCAQLAKSEADKEVDVRFLVYLFRALHDADAAGDS